MTTLSEYLQTWRLKLSHTKTATAAFYLHNREAKRELKVCNIGTTLPFCPVPTYLRVKLDRSLTYRPHLEALRKKAMCSRLTVEEIAGTGWGASVKTLRTAALSLINSTAEYCAPVWCRSAHTRLIDSVLFVSCIFILLSRESDQCAIRARLGVADHLSTTPRWGNPAKCLSQRHNK